MADEDEFEDDARPSAPRRKPRADQVVERLFTPKQLAALREMADDQEIWRRLKANEEELNEMAEQRKGMKAVWKLVDVVRRILIVVSTVGGAAILAKGWLIDTVRSGK